MQQETAPATSTTIAIPENVLFDVRNADWIEDAAKNGIYFICNPSKTAVATINELLSNEVAAIAIRNNPEEETQKYIINLARSFIHYWLGVPFKEAVQLTFTHIADIFKNIQDGESSVTTMADQFYMQLYYKERLKSLHARYDLSQWI